MVKTKIKYNRILAFFLVLFTITTSGANWSIVLLFGVSLLGLIYNRFRIGEKTNIMRVGSLLILLAFNSFVINYASSDVHEYIVYMMRFFSIIIIVSVLSYQNFMDICVRIIAMVLVVGEIVWFIGLLENIVGITLLPELISSYFLHDTVSIFPRLRGIFWEAGVMQIYANLVISYLILFDKTKAYKKVLLLCIFGVFATMSTTGYIILVVQLLLYCFHRYDFPQKVGKRILCIIMVLIALFLVEELTIGVISSKLISGKSSATSRFDDTIIALRIAKDHWISGIGVATDWHMVFIDYFYNDPFYLKVRKYYMPDLASSNGLCNCMYKAGIPFTFFYLSNIFRRYRKDMNCSFVESFLMVLIYLFIFIGEPIMGTPFMLLIFVNFNSINDTCEVK